MEDACPALDTHPQPRNRVLLFLDQQFDLTHAADVRPRNRLPVLFPDSERMQRLHPAATVAWKRESTRFREHVEREHRRRAKDVVFGHASLMGQRIGVAHALGYQSRFVRGCDPADRLKVAVEHRNELDVVRSVRKQLWWERSLQPYSRAIVFVHGNDLG